MFAFIPIFVDQVSLLKFPFSWLNSSFNRLNQVKAPFLLIKAPFLQVKAPFLLLIFPLFRCAASQRSLSGYRYLDRWSLLDTWANQAEKGSEVGEFLVNSMVYGRFDISWLLVSNIWIIFHILGLSFPLKHI
jgi:hypothetical protein